MTSLLNSTAIECFITGATNYAMSSTGETTLFYVAQTAIATPLNQVSTTAISKFVCQKSQVEE